MADESTFPLDGDGLREVVWDECDAPFAGPFVASPADAEGRGIALSVTRGGEAVDLTGASLYLLWRHRELRVRGCEPLEEVDAEAGRFRVFWPAAMARAEGTVDAQVMVSWDERALSSLSFTVLVGPALVGGEGGGSDGYSLFLDALKKFEDADGVIADAVAKAQEAVTTAQGAVATAGQAVEAAQGASGAVAAANAAAWGCANAMREMACAAPLDHTDVWMASRQRVLHADLEDDLIIAAALRAKADYLVTNDEGLLRHCPVATLDARDMVALLETKDVASPGEATRP